MNPTEQIEKDLCYVAPQITHQTFKDSALHNGLWACNHDCPAC